MMGYVPDHGRTHAIPSDMIGVVVSDGQPVVVGQPHQARGLARREQAGAHTVALDNKDRLSTRSAGGGAKASVHAIEANLGPLSFDAVRIGAGALIDAAHNPAACLF